MPRTVGRRAGGFTYLGLLVVLALWSALVAGWAQQAALAQRRERERELLFRGGQIARAIASYRAAQPGGLGPRSFDDLLADHRAAPARHHLRRVWTDPFTGRGDWVALRDEQGGWTGVHSRADMPRLLLQAGPPAQGRRLSDWHFVAGTPEADGGGPP